MYSIHEEYELMKDALYGKHYACLVQGIMVLILHFMSCRSFIVNNFNQFDDEKQCMRCRKEIYHDLNLRYRG